MIHAAAQVTLIYGAGNQALDAVAEAQSCSENSGSFGVGGGFARPAGSRKGGCSALGTRGAQVTIVRDDWGIAHIYGKTDADAVFGMVYAQAEDDFNRVETNYINAMGRLAEAEGESRSIRTCA